MKANGTGDAPTIQAAIDSASNGDEILVRAGRYTWSNQGGGNEYGMIFVARGKDRLKMRSESGPEATILDGQNQSRVMFIQGFNDMLVEGFTFTGGNAPEMGYYAGGGLATHLSGDIVRNCIFEFNHAQQGGGIWCGGVSTLRVEDCTFRFNTATYGGAILFVNSNTKSVVTRCVIDKNDADTRGGGIYGLNNKLEISETVFTRNEAFGAEGGALYLREMWPSTISSCTMVANIAPTGSGVYLLACPSITLETSIIAFNGGPAFDGSATNVMTASCNDVYGNATNSFPAGSVDAGGNFSVDPGFCDVLSAQNFYLHSSSPCAAGNHPTESACGLIGALDVNCGGVSVEEHSWGALKAMYQ